MTGLFRFSLYASTKSPSSSGLTPAKALYGRIAENHQNGLALLDFVGLVAFLLEFRERNGHLLAGLRQRFPVGQGVGQIDAGPLPILPQRHAELPQQQAQLQMGDHEGRGQDFKAENPRQRRLLECAVVRAAPPFSCKVCRIRRNTSTR